MSGEERLKYLLKKLVGSKEFSFSERNWKKMKAMLPDRGEEQFKSSLNKLIEEKEFPFSESNWEKMSALLPERERKNRLVPIMWAAVGLLFVGVALLVGLRSELVNPKSQVANHKAEEIKTETVRLKEDTKDTRHKTQDIRHKTQEPSHKSKSNIQKIETNFPETVEKEKTTSPEKPVISEIEQTEKEPNRQPQIINQQPSIDSEQLATKEPSNIHNYPISEQQYAIRDTIKGDVNETSEVLPPQLAMNKPEADTIKQNTLIKQLTISNVEQEVLEQTTQETVITEPKKTKKSFMYFEAGGDYLLGWKNANKKEGNGFNPVVGFNYYNYLNDKLAVSLGAQYTLVNNLNNYSNTSKKITRYTFGEEGQVTIITPQKIHYLLVPIKLNYFLDTLNSFGIGFNAAYLLTVGGTMETYDVHLNKKENYKSGKVNGYTEGFNTFDTQVSVFYHRRLYKNWGVAAEVFFGLSDIKNDLFFNSALKERNKGVKLTLTYTVFK